MSSSIQVAAVQFPVAIGDIETNLLQAERALRQLREKGVRLAVLPEMWSSGYDYPRLEQLAEQTPQVTGVLERLTAELDMVVVGSLPEKDRDRLFNTAFVHDRGREAGRYRKLHLFSPMQEDRYLSAGDRTLVTDTSAGRLGLAICYDLRFPELFRKLALEGAELICLPAQWPSPRQELWQTLLRARAIENQCFLIAANNCGTLGKLRFFGMSQILSPRGEILAEGGTRAEAPNALADRADMAAYRQEIPAWQDRRPEIYGRLDGSRQGS